jgi:hypothetical protein
MIFASSLRATLPGTVALGAANDTTEQTASPLAAELIGVSLNAVSLGFAHTRLRSRSLNVERHGD